jgi:hypothetical protein
MTKKELWKIYTARNPTFDGEGTVTMTAAGLRKLFDTTWDVAFHDGEDEPVERVPPSGNLDALKQIFGMK